MEKNREIYIDNAKGFAIYSVILVHLNTFLDSPFPLLHYIINSYMLPLFFLVSGFFAYKNDYHDINIHIKTKQLILPYLTVGFLVCLIYAVLFQVNLYTRFIGDESKGGYWFLLVLYFYFVILKLLLYVKCIWGISDSLFIFLLILPFCGILVLGMILSKDISSLLSLSSLRRYYIFFFSGVLLKKYDSFYASLFSSKFWISFLLLYIIILLFNYDDQTVLGFFIWSLNALLGCIAILNLCKCCKCMNVFSYYGYNTLGIYILHYIFIYFLKYLYEGNHIKIILHGRICIFVLFIVLSCTILYLTNILVIKIRKSYFSPLLGA